VARQRALIGPLTLACSLSGRLSLLAWATAGSYTKRKICRAFAVQLGGFVVRMLARGAIGYGIASSLGKLFFTFSVIEFYKSRSFA